MWEWNARTSYTDALGRRTEIAWNEDGQIASCIQSNGGFWKYDYDERSNLKCETDPRGRKRCTAWRADIPLPESETDAAGRKRIYEYDDRYNLIAEHWHWSQAGLLTEHQASLGRRTHYD